MAPAKRRAYQAGFKLMAIRHALEHGNRASAREFHVAESMVRKWRKQEPELRQVSQSRRSFRGNKARWPQLEDRVGRWAAGHAAAGGRLSALAIRLVAVEMARDMRIDDFRGGGSWCFRFMKRRNLSVRPRSRAPPPRGRGEQPRAGSDARPERGGIKDEVSRTCDIKAAQETGEVSMHVVRLIVRRAFRVKMQKNT